MIQPSVIVNAIVARDRSHFQLFSVGLQLDILFGNFIVMHYFVGISDRVAIVKQTDDKKAFVINLTKISLHFS